MGGGRKGWKGKEMDVVHMQIRRRGNSVRGEETASKYPCKKLRLRARQRKVAGPVTATGGAAGLGRAKLKGGRCGRLFWRASRCRCYCYGLKTRCIEFGTFRHTIHCRL